MPERRADRAAGAGDDWRVRIRMYRLGIGDCFLLSFAVDRNGGRSQHHVLIDCGILQGSPNATRRIRAVADNIAEVTGQRLDVLVATHEHMDHVSGFLDAGDVFSRIEVGQIWVAWTEDERDPAAMRLKQERRLRLQALRLAEAELRRFATGETEAYSDALTATLGFFGAPEPAVAGSPFAFAEKTDRAMRAVTERPGGPLPKFCNPGDVLRPDWDGDLRVYVLGPPRDEKHIKDTQGRAGDIYRLSGIDALYVSALEARLLAAGAGGDGSRTGDRFFPFHPSLRWESPEQIREDPGLEALVTQYQDEKLAWRRIDNEWLVSSARMALQLDDATNNTSLVLAFELSDGRVLLFPGDAQIGSWKTWRDVTWTAKKAERPAALSGADLLQRTVFYKVSHHGSENGTRKPDGLEAMIDRRLVANLPVDQEYANASRKWRMPADALLRRLTERSQGRVVRADPSWQGPDEQPPDGVQAHIWQAFRDSVRPDPNGLFIDTLIA